MNIKKLESAFLNSLIKNFDSWVFKENERSFRKRVNNINWYFHITHAQFGEYFEASADVAIEFLDKGNQVCIIGAQLYNIDGAGYKSFPVKSIIGAKISAFRLKRYFKKVGLPFLQKYSDPELVLSTLKKGGREADLISPIPETQKADIVKLDAFVSIAYNQSFNSTPKSGAN